MDINLLMAKARNAVQIIQEGRRALEAVRDAIADGKVALDTKSQGELNALLADEQRETQAAHASLADAIRQARGQ